MSYDIISRQALVEGRVTDSITLRAPRAPARVSLVRVADGRPVEHVATNVRPDGWFSVHGDPLRMVPAQAIALRLEVVADGYRSAIAAITLTVDDLARVPRTIMVARAAAETTVLAGLPKTCDLALEPLPVMLEGRVTRTEDPALAIPGATIAVTAPAALPAVVADGQGRFRIGPLPVAATLTLAIAAAGRIAAAPEFRPDYRRATNERSFTLEPS
jgi:hypothetical protein